MWKIHGKYYDLTPYLSKHPGGRIILEQSKGNKDLTAAFESYHAMSNMHKIKRIMKKFEVKDKEYISQVNFDEKGFYSTLTSDIKMYFLNKNISHHANMFWLIKSTIQVLLWIISFFMTCYLTNIYFYQRIILSAISGHMFIQVGFGIMHDASHHAITRYSNVNETLASIWNSLALWDNSIWYKHHCYMHHSYTGTKLDPDTIHFKPFIQKSELENNNNYFKYTHFRALFGLCVFPGMWIGQSIAYIGAIIKQRLWRMSIINYKICPFEVSLKFFMVFSLFYIRDFWIMFAYIISCNITYGICILPDHDTFETHNNILYDTKNVDWGELQVRNSGNFSTQNFFINNCFGGINHQITHHLFPTISHVHYPEISKIVKEKCKEFDIPYVEHKSMLSAIFSVFKNFKNISNK